MTLVLRKLLASSTFAIAGALDSIRRRLETKLTKSDPVISLADELDQDFEALDETADEWPEDETPEPLTAEDRNAINAEIADLQQFRDLAVSITHNSKGHALVVALNRAFAEAERLGAQRKAIIFTESRKTQDYLLRVLADGPHRDKVVLFNGSNNDEKSRQIYSSWIEQHAGTDRITGSRTADMRSALVDYFREQGEVMIATEAGAEGINLQFCSLVVNYDLPWNPQRIEQRIGRCHRYGQMHDVVVVNFLNQKNEADQRVFQLLSEKFRLFEGVFGASDEVLGAIESGVDFEKRISGIYQRCRHSDQIKAAFDQLQVELSAQINDAMTRTRQQLLENFDDEVREKLRVHDERSRSCLSRYEQLLMRLTRFELAQFADFDSDSSFTLRCNLPDIDVPTGRYELPRRSGQAHLYRLGHPLAQALIEVAKGRSLPPAEIVFDLTGYVGRISPLEPYLGRSGLLIVVQFTVESLDTAEDHLILAATTDDGDVLEEGVAQRLFSLSATSTQDSTSKIDMTELTHLVESRQQSIQRTISQRNAQFFELEAEKLDGWADDLKAGLERDIKEIDRQIKEARRSATTALTLEEKLAGQKQIKHLELHRTTKRRSLFDAQDEIDRRRTTLIEEIEGKLQQQTSPTVLFTIRWMLR